MRNKMMGLLVMGVALAAAVPVLAQDECGTAQMTVTAEISQDPGFVGLWKYTVSGSWDVGRYALSHIDFFLALDNCECVCDPVFIQFSDPAGASEGAGSDGDPCTVEYVGDYLCMGDPSIPSAFNSPTIKFDAVEVDGCEPETSGMGSWCFYTPLPPAAPLSYPGAVAIKHGQELCLGDLSGTLPVCDCSVPVAATTWGRLKARHE